MTSPTVLVTRPEHQAGPLSEALRQRGMQVTEFPLLRICPVADPAAAVQALDALSSASVVVFVSANAVREGIRLCPDLLIRLASTSVAALGGGTARELARNGWCAEVLTPRGTTTESLLALDQFSETAMRGTCVGIVKGEGGRALLARALGERGASVLEAGVYRRMGPGPGFEALLAKHGASISVAIVTSAEALGHLADLAAGDRGQVLAWPLVLPSQRVADRALMLGFRGAIAVAPAMCDGCVADTARELVAATADGRA